VYRRSRDVFQIVVYRHCWIDKCESANMGPIKMKQDICQNCLSMDLLFCFHIISWSWIVQ